MQTQKTHSKASLQYTTNAEETNTNNQNSSKLPLGNTPNTNSFPSFDNNTQFKHYRYRNTPIWIRGSEDEGFYLTVGDYVLTEKQESPGDCEKLLKNRDLNLMMSLMSAVFESTKDYENINKTQKETMEEEPSKGFDEEKNEEEDEENA